MKKIDIYTDGACSCNPGKGGIGAVILDDGRQVATLKEGYQHSTNNRMEILAAIRAIEVVREYILDNGIDTRETDIKVTVLSDSQLLVNTMRPKDPWSKKTNKDLWERLEQAVNRLEYFTAELPAHIKVDFDKVKGHADDAYNNLADSLAVAGREKHANQMDVDETYEKIHAFGGAQAESIPEPEVKDIRFLGENDPDNRKIKAVLTNGTVVSIIGYQNGFEQFGCTQRESAVTVNLAWKYVGWLNGRGKLF